ncbi:MAG: ABC transporter ATP-binding protein [Holosporales bacterium]|jgi:subfamily B ATP-binding cassette protein MsbA
MSSYYPTPVLVRRLWKEHVRKYRNTFLLAVLCMMLVAASTAAMAKLMEPVLDEVFVAKNGAMLWLVGLAVIGVFSLKAVASYGESLFLTSVGDRVVTDVQKRSYAHLLRADVAYFHEHTSSGLLSRVAYDAGSLRAMVSGTLTAAFKDAMTIIFLVGMLFYQDWGLAMVSFFTFPIAIVFIAKLGRKVRRFSTTASRETGAFTSFIQESFQGIRHVKAYNREDFETQRGWRQMDAVLNLSMKMTRIRAISSPIMELLGGVAIVTVILYGGHQVITGAKTTGSFFSFITALLLAYEPLKRLSKVNLSIQEGLAGADRLYQVLDTIPTIHDKPGSKPLDITKGEIRFENVTFRYANGHEALKNLSFTVPPGKFVALVGPSGAGKSTIFHLLLRFYETQEGHVLFDGQNISTATVESLRASTALVSQDVNIFNDTAEANIRYGRLDATDEEIRAAAADAAALSFIDALPHGFATRLGENGTLLSGGQRQRIAIARAMIKDAPILLLDEATSALDAESERSIQKAIARLAEGRTTLVIAHRFSTILNADTIIVLDKGQMVEMGNHAELLSKGGLYAKLYRLQQAEDAKAAFTAA